MLKISDIECYPNFFLIVFKDYKTKQFDCFEISDRMNELLELREYLYNHRNTTLVGFNFDGYDYPVLHDSVLKYDSLTPYQIKNISDKVINTKYSSIRQKERLLTYIDLFKVWHYDNKNKSTSLKWLEFAMRMNNVEDLPYHHQRILSDDEKDKVIEYCKHDCNATMKFFDKSLKQLTLRKEYSQIEGENMMNYSEIAISKAVFGKALAKEMGINVWDLNKMRTPRSRVDISEIIFDYVKFNDPANQEALETFKSKVWRYDHDLEKSLESIKFTLPYKNVIREYAEGGLHSFGKAGIYETDGDYVLIDVDYASYYPHLTFRNQLHPAHIPEKVFNRIYEGFYIDRKKYSKKDVRNYVLKIILNGSYGLSKDKYSFLYDPRWQLQICINGQLILAMLTERIFEKCKHEPQIIFENTDGAMYRIHRSDLELLNQACKEIETIVNIPLETQECQKIIIRDVNNYINVINDKEIKFKGAFEIDRDYHKNHSKRVVPLSLANYFINGIKPEETIENYLKPDFKVLVPKEFDYDNNKIIYYDKYGLYDFCIGSKAKGDNKVYQRHVINEIDKITHNLKESILLEYGYKKENNVYVTPSGNVSLDEAFDIVAIENRYVLDTPLSKTTRYVVANEGVQLIKKLPPLNNSFKTKTDLHKEKINPNQMDIFDIIEEEVRIEPDDRESNLEVGFLCKVLNIISEDTIDSADSIVNKQYYIEECYKVIDKINKVA